ncbi:MAG: serine hydroxymethyltransferase, partial [Helicobacter sp.]|nr:serine hydroxymethyltransferase [Helicobacter sp.]
AWREYAKAVKLNAKTLAEVLIQRGYKIVSDGTDNHLVLLSLLDKEFSGKEADLALGNAGITVNKNTVPGETRSPFITSGVRIGTPALSARGFKEKEFVIVANKIADVLDDIENTQKQALIKSELKELAIKFPIYTKAIF